jgi:hypothetical protein
MSDDPLAVCSRHLANSQHIIEAKNAEIAQLKEAIRLIADQYATLTVQGCDVIVTMDATFTPEEREAISLAYSRLTADAKYEEVAATLRNLLERTK